jgi:hypothetical protein
LVKQPPAPATFHDETSLYPIGFKADYLDDKTGLTFENSVLDGMDVFSEDVPAFQVKVTLVLGESAVTLTDKKPQAVWKLVRPTPPPPPPQSAPFAVFLFLPPPGEKVWRWRGGGGRLGSCLVLLRAWFSRRHLQHSAPWYAS